ncbi:hypothetical protein SAMN02910369_02620 [Lachnospiraceae bacterium NE2001]|nr:hypothetical protein SAMN02910369_02620 [Lachnospiraceae bacterium NE2001]
MKNSKKEVVITGKMVVRAAMLVALVALVGITIYGIVTGDSRLLGETSMFACLQTVFWSYTSLENKKEKEAKKNEVVA